MEGGGVGGERRGVRDGVGWRGKGGRRVRATYHVIATVLETMPVRRRTRTPGSLF